MFRTDHLNVLRREVAFSYEKPAGRRGDLVEIASRSLSSSRAKRGPVARNDSIEIQGELLTQDTGKEKDAAYLLPRELPGRSTPLVGDITEAREAERRSRRDQSSTILAPVAPFSRRRR